jgi:hypothetical protein
MECPFHFYGICMLQELIPSFVYGKKSVIPYLSVVNDYIVNFYYIVFKSLSYVFSSALR